MGSCVGESRLLRSLDGSYDQVLLTAGPRLRKDSALKNVSISLTEQHAREIEREIAAGGYASVSEVIRAALREFLIPVHGPDPAQVERDVAAYRAARSAGVPLIEAAAAEAAIAVELTAPQAAPQAE